MESSLLSHHPSVGPLLTESAQRAKVLEGMLRAVAEKGFAAATVADAVRLARVSRGTFYALFDSKEACLASAYRLGCEVLEARITAAVREAADWREELRLGLRAYLHTLEEDPLFARVYLLESAGGRGRAPGHADPLHRPLSQDLRPLGAARAAGRRPVRPGGRHPRARLHPGARREARHRPRGHPGGLRRAARR